MNIRLVFSSFKIKNYFSYKDPIPDNLKSLLVYKFTCASSSSSCIGETCRHSKTRIEEHIKKDSKSHIFKLLHSTRICFDSYNSLSFKIIDRANSKFDLKFKEALYINCKKPNLNAQQNHLSSTLSRQLPSPLFYFCFFICLFGFFVFAAFLCHLLFLIIFDTNYWHRLLS